MSQNGPAGTGAIRPIGPSGLDGTLGWAQGRRTLPGFSSGRAASQQAAEGQEGQGQQDPPAASLPEAQPEGTRASEEWRPAHTGPPQLGGGAAGSCRPSGLPEPPAALPRCRPPSPGSIAPVALLISASHFLSPRLPAAAVQDARSR